MAYPDDSQATAPTPTPPQPAQAPGSDVAGQWRDWIQDPQNRASLMQFGISLMQPIGVGQSPMGHLGQALGAGAEASDRVKMQQMAEQKLASETDLRESRANLAEKQAAFAGERSGLEGQKLALQQQALELKKMLGPSALAERMVEKFYATSIINPGLKLEDFIKANLQAVKQIQAAGGVAPQGGARSQQEQAALAWANDPKNASDPRAAQIKQALGA